MAVNNVSNSDKPKLLIVVFLIFISATAGFFGGWLGTKNKDFLSDTSSTRQIVANESQLINKIAEDVGPSVVSIQATQNTAVNSIFGVQHLSQKSAGTGFIIDSSGIIVTNRHVVPAGVTKVLVILSDDTVLDDVSVIGRTASDDPLDIAFLKVNNKKGHFLKPVKLGDSSKMEVGFAVVAIGNALGQLQNSVTSGIISGFGRSVQAGDESASSVENLQNLFQTDAAINRGNSGGPLVNINGEVIGINTATAGGNAQDIGFAIPTNDVGGIIKSVLQSGKLQRPYLGVRYIMLNDGLAAQYKLDTKHGAYVIPTGRGQTPSIISNSPADKAGLRDGDIITKVNGIELSERNVLSSEVGRYQVGDKLKLTVNRNGQVKTVSVTLDTLPAS